MFIIIVLITLLIVSCFLIVVDRHSFFPSHSFIIQSLVDPVPRLLRQPDQDEALIPPRSPTRHHGHSISNARSRGIQSFPALPIGSLEQPNLSRRFEFETTTLGNSKPSGHCRSIRSCQEEELKGPKSEETIWRICILCP